MMREVQDVKKCPVCLTVVQALVRDAMEDEEGSPVVAIYWLPRRVHTGDDCARALRLYTEEWPVLFDVDRAW